MKKIVIIGPESTGKSTLCEKLAAYYQTSWCPEFAREYLLQNGTDYTYENLLDIAKGQVALEEKYIKEVEGAHARNTTKTGSSATTHSPLTTHHSLFTPHTSPILFIDTNMYVMQVWCNFVFGKTHSWILNQLIQRKYDLYLLCNIDLPWVKDELREYPDLERREKLYNIYKAIMLNQPVPWIDISGSYEARFQKALHAVEALQKKS